jgi:hypothetical protein
MNRLSGRMKLGLAAASVVGVALVIVVNYTEVCRLQEVTVNDASVPDWRQRYPMLDTNLGPLQSLQSMAEKMLEDTNVYKVDLSWSLPHRLEINTNRFTPECFLLDEKTARLHGLDDQGRVVPLVRPVDNWERPVLTGLTVHSMFERCSDTRVEVVARKLTRLRHEHRDLLRLIEEVNFADQFGLTVTVAGLPYRLKLRAETMIEDMDRFARFITRFGVDLEEVRLMDLRFDDMIICERGEG